MDFVIIIALNVMMMNTKKRGDKMTVEEVYTKYKHLDEALCDKFLTCHNFPGTILYDLWQAIKEKCEKK